MWLADLQGLLTNLGIARSFVVGRSRTSRVALRFALRHPGRCLGLGLWGISGGAAARRFLDAHYFGKYEDACVRGGMAAVCRTGHFGQLIEQDPDNQARLMAVDPKVFLAAIARWRVQFHAGAASTVMGLPDAFLAQVATPTAIVMQYDRMHPTDTARHAQRAIRGSRLFDFDPGNHVDRDVRKDMPRVAGILTGYFSGLPI